MNRGLGASALWLSNSCHPMLRAARYRSNAPSTVGDLRVAARGLEKVAGPSLIRTQALVLDFRKIWLLARSLFFLSASRCSDPTSSIVLITSSQPQWIGDSTLPTELVAFHSTVFCAFISSDNLPHS
ncbi:hypothetical protein HBI56_126040 [Parastagonospora nodorum]|uniref:Uncharacterized protein n=1 Tax=Phaeosphaeria nodorum (strain SN15 / ATCC MYA-4574 / FGSC 10173) TaxID=321614 RepID=A0A7U2I429_PHANO|nr:hypothetical protein HBH56_167390 [Parastagonospora nodorum]QRC98622.1 hypothetical protein JI435_412370 [Parastagonospora nodorum SN15]KAH3936180.1 hypothetical protein HBH54_030480 [Parastagonospora nodorum]KAH3948272.1 hypothetical protein HBH53_105260 [Parastagonospora nodorum]KAH3968638.1 hypothetical protein HBH51_129160 [Parastagonospora nodorum]